MAPTSPTLDTRLFYRERPTQQAQVMHQQWRELLFLHWTIDPAEIQKTLPPGLYVDTFEDHAYLGLVPFYMRGIRPRFCPPVPGISNFLEVNVRTYVYDERGVPGVWFYSLDANQWLAVQAARLFFKLPYFYAKMEAVQQPNKQIDYTSWRRDTDRTLTTRFSYRLRGDVWLAEPGTLEFFLVERYILFAYQPKTGKLSTGQVYHLPYTIGEVDVPVWDTSLFTLNGFASPERPPDHALMSPGVVVDVFPLTRV